MDDLLWWLGGFGVFVVLFDLSLVAMRIPTISRVINKRFGMDIAPASFFFVLGALFVHFTNFRVRQEDESELQD